MTHKHLAAVIAITLASAVPAAPQTVTATTGAIDGIVTDSSQATLPGVTITLSGPAAMGTPSTVSGQNGSYQFSAVAPGDYQLTFELPGFGPVTRDGIHVGINFIATVSVEMSPGTVAQTATVSSEARVVDVTSSAVTTHF